MLPDNGSPGVHRAILIAPAGFARGFARESFHILLDEDDEQIIYPEMSGASSGLSAWMGPDSLGSEMWWVVNEEPGAKVHVCLDLNQRDRRQAVTWSSLD